MRASYCVVGGKTTDRLIRPDQTRSDQALSIKVSQPPPPPPTNIIPTPVLLGVLGGAAGAGFTWLNLKLMKLRNRWIARIRWRRLAEVVAVAFVTTTLAVCLPAAFPCLPVDCAASSGLAGCTARLASSGVEAAEVLNRYTCPVGQYNPAATLLFTSGDKTIERLLKRGTHFQFDYAAVIALLIIYFLLACCTAGMAQASGACVRPYY